MKSVYISGALKGSRDIIAARDLYEWAAGKVREEGLSAYLPHKATDPVAAGEANPDTVFEIDLAAIRSSSAVVSFVSEPSLGVGAEVAICMAESTPLLALAERGCDVSRFILGLIEKGGGEFHYYENREDAGEYIAKFLQRGF